MEKQGTDPALAADDSSDLSGSLGLQLLMAADAIALLVVEACDVPTAIDRTYTKYKERLEKEHRLTNSVT